MTFLLTAVCDPQAQMFFEQLRVRYYPPERNQVPAHIQLFHQLPEEEAESIFKLLASVTARHAVTEAEVAPPRSSGRGILFPLIAPDLCAVHAKLTTAWRARLIPQDLQGYRPHIVVQNKVDPAVVKQTLPELTACEYPKRLLIAALRVWRYLDGPWEPVEEFLFSDSQTPV